MDQKLFQVQSGVTFLKWLFVENNEVYSHVFLKKINSCQNSCAYSRLEDFLERTGKIISLDIFGIYWYIKVGEVTFC